MRWFGWMAFCLAICLGNAFAQDCKKTEYSGETKTYLENAVQQFVACHAKNEGFGSCRSSAAQALEHIYGVKDLGSGDKYLDPTAIAKKVKADWEHLGPVSDQEALKKAQAAAGCGRAVVAVLSAENGGHVAIILPGPLSHSAGWKLDTPNSASFFMHNPGKSFAGKPLAYSFGSPNGVEIYVKK